MFGLIETIAFVFGVVALGYLAGLTGLMRREVGEGLTEFAVGLCLPMLLFRTIVVAEFGGAAPWGLWIAYFSAVFIAWGAAFAVLTLGFGLDGRTGVAGSLSSGFSNLLMLGTPLSLGVFGQEGFSTLSLIISIHLPIMMALSIILFEFFRPKNIGSPGATAVISDFGRKLFLNPIIVGILFGLLWRATGVAVPSLIERFVDAFANAAVPIALFAMGLSLRRFGVGGKFGAVFWLTGLKLVLMPAAALLIAWMLDLPPLTAKVAVLGASLPSGINPYLIATRFGTGQDLTSNAMTLGTALAALTCMGWLFIAEQVFG